ncbi:single-stranded-DNA-specific exonuclease RecJ [Subdoligranulum variabile]|nr:single-stranded-DNA-specific exonuclease RecJ [Subdoligranulum variabile]UWP67987.1 single-stranded-DNA-specific exonuclease RecJ [Subdoligranulum variabile]
MKYPAWQIRTAEPGAEDTLAAAGCGVLLRRVLAARGIRDTETARQMLEPAADLSDPFLLRDMDKAVARIGQAIEAEEPIVIYGDYDVDGISATALLYECLSSQGAHVRCKLPTRGSGYGLTRPALEALAQKGFTLVVTVDNGISAVEEAACAKELGLDLVITDHHLPGDVLPEAVAVVDPKRADDESPFKNLCGAGVAFKLCAALEGCNPAELLEMYGEFVALGTVADVMPLVGENRVLVREGLALLQDTMRPGLHALLESGGYAGKPVTTDTVSYGLAPRLNAAGRMDNASVALKLLLCGDEEQATGIAARLAEINTERQQTEQAVFASACGVLEADPARLRDRVLVVAGEDWHPGVIGIVAARLMERYSRPVIVISLHDGEGRGSGRAPDSFDLHSALAACAENLTRFGGHAAAAGIEIEEEKLPVFRQAINEWAARHAARPAPAMLQLDAVVKLEELTLENVRDLTRLAPFGRENPTPVLLVRDAVIDGVWAMGAEGRHTRVRLRQGNHTMFASLFGVTPQKFAYPVGTAVEAALEVSIFTGRSGPMVSAHLKGIRPANLSNTPSEQAAWFEAFCAGAELEPVRAEVLLPDRSDTVMLYKRIRGGQVFAEDLQPTFAAQGAENTGKTLASLMALRELGLIEEQDGRWLPVPVSGKQDLASAPVLRKLAQAAQR